MSKQFEMKMIARIQSDFKSKFGIPRQSGIATSVQARIIFEPEYRDVNSVRGLEGFSHIWLIWQFSEVSQDKWSPTVRPPRLGGNKRMGVFATRSPFRPNPIGLSSVKLDQIEIDSNLGPILYVSGADLLDGTPIYDIKPYLPYADSHSEAEGGFAQSYHDYKLQVEFPDILLEKVPVSKRVALIEVLSQDPRPSYQNAPQRLYGMSFANMDIKFTVKEDKLIVCNVIILK